MERAEEKCQLNHVCCASGQARPLSTHRSHGCRESKPPREASRRPEAGPPFGWYGIARHQHRPPHPQYGRDRVQSALWTQPASVQMSYEDIGELVVIVRACMIN
jgi:hypothetical protein